MDVNVRGALAVGQVRCHRVRKGSEGGSWGKGLLKELGYNLACLDVCCLDLCFHSVICFALFCSVLLTLFQVAAQSMKSRGVPGAIVNVSSQASEVGLPDHTAYCVSKGALDQLTRVMAVELGPANIRVNSVNPTVVLTEMGKAAWSDEAKAAPMLARIPLRRFAEEQDVVNAIVFLLSDKAAMVNGAFLPVDGGFWSA